MYAFFLMRDLKTRKLTNQVSISHSVELYCAEKTLPYAKVVVSNRLRSHDPVKCRATA